MRSQDMINYEEMAYARPTFNIFKSDFLFLSDHFRPSGTQNEKKKCYRIVCLKNNGHQGLRRRQNKLSSRQHYNSLERCELGP